MCNGVHMFVEWRGLRHPRDREKMEIGGFLVIMAECIPLHTSRNVQACDGLRERNLLIFLTPRIASSLRTIVPKLLIHKEFDTLV